MCAVICSRLLFLMPPLQVLGDWCSIIERVTAPSGVNIIRAEALSDQITPERMQSIVRSRLVEGSLNSRVRDEKCKAFFFARLVCIFVFSIALFDFFVFCLHHFECPIIFNIYRYVHTHNMYKSFLSYAGLAPDAGL